MLTFLQKQTRVASEIVKELAQAQEQDRFSSWDPVLARCMGIVSFQLIFDVTVSILSPQLKSAISIYAQGGDAFLGQQREVSVR